MTNDATPYLDFIEYRCALVCLSLSDTSKDIREYDIVPATEEQVFGGVRSTDSLFTKGINNIRFKLFLDRRTNQFLFAFDGTKTVLDGIDDAQQWFGQATEIYQQAREAAGPAGPPGTPKRVPRGETGTPKGVSGEPKSVPKALAQPSARRIENISRAGFIRTKENSLN